jgi:hypothetical protein
MFEFLMSILTYIINFFMGLFGFKSDATQDTKEQEVKQVTFSEVAETSTGEIQPTLPPADISA